MEWLDPVQEASVEKAWTKGHKAGLTKGLEKGLEKGREKGLEKGRKEGAAKLLESQITRRFGMLPGALRKKLANASEEQLVEWGAALLDAPSLKHIFK